MEPIRVGIIEDQDLIRASLVQLIDEEQEFELMLAVSSVEDFLEQAKSDLVLDVLLLDIQLPGMTGLDGIPHIKAQFPALNIVILTTFDDENHIYHALQLGAISYLTKRESINSISQAIRVVNKGGSYMTPAIARKVLAYFSTKPSLAQTNLTSRQREIAQGIMEGLPYKNIAAKYEISIHTVQDHIKVIYKKLQINSRMELVYKYSS